MPAITSSPDIRRGTAMLHVLEHLSHLTTSDLCELDDALAELHAKRKAPAEVAPAKAATGDTLHLAQPMGYADNVLMASKQAAPRLRLVGRECTVAGLVADLKAAGVHSKALAYVAQATTVAEAHERMRVAGLQLASAEARQ